MTSNQTFSSHFQPQAPDPLLKLIGAYRSDPRPEKIDLGVGVFRNVTGHTPVLATVKKAEQMLIESQSSKSYLGPEGNIAFAAALKALVLGPEADGRAVAIQTPGGTGALRLAMDLVALAKSGAKVWVGTPSWPNHYGLAAAAGVEVCRYPFFDQKEQRVLFAETVAALKSAAAGDVVLFHGCCHNPSGAAFTTEEWTMLAKLASDRGLVPLIDLAYQGLGDGFEEDGAMTRLFLRHCPEVLIAYSCDKNFALYRERVGALFVRAVDGAAAETVFSNLLALARTNWSMPPDHGGAVVQLVLEDALLRNEWLGEVDMMRRRIADMRRILAAADSFFAPVGAQRGMFSLLPLSTDQVARLKSDFGIYMASSGRINVAGLTPDNIPRFVAACRAVL